MDTLLSTVAQISFTIVGFFLLALTVDADTRVYWLAQKEHALYVSLIFLNMLLPGLLSVGLLIQGTFLSLPAWFFVSVTLFVAYIFLAITWSKAQKQTEVKQLIANYESTFDVKGTLRFTIGVLGALLIVGIFIRPLEISASNVSFWIGLALVFLILGSVISAYAFLRKNTEVRNRESFPSNVANSETKSLEDKKVSNKSTGIIYIFALFMGLFFYLLGVFSRKE